MKKASIVALIVLILLALFFITGCNKNYHMIYTSDGGVYGANAIVYYGPDEYGNIICITGNVDSGKLEYVYQNVDKIFNTYSKKIIDYSYSFNFESWYANY